MSGYVAGLVWFLELPRVEKMVLLKLADSAHDDGTKIYPSIAYVAHLVRCSRRTVQRTLKKHRTPRGDEPALLIVTKPAGAKRRHSTEYRFDMAELKRRAAIGEAEADAIRRTRWRERGPAKKLMGDTVSPINGAPGPVDGRHDVSPIKNLMGDISKFDGRHDVSPSTVLRTVLDDDGAREVIELFDRAIAEAYGSSGRRSGHRSDQATARAWLDLGATLDLLGKVFADQLAKRRRQRLSAPLTLKLLDGTVRDAIAIASAAATRTAAKADRKAIAAASKVDGCTVADTMLRPATPEELAAYRDRYPWNSDATEAPGWFIAAYRAGRLR